MNDSNAILNICQVLEIKDKVSVYTGEQQQFEVLVAHINHLILTDFNRLLHILYRIDVSEEKLKTALKTNNDREPSARIIAKLMIDRETEKIHSRSK